MRYGKFVGEQLIVHDSYKPLTLSDGSTVFTNDPAVLLPMGYKLLIYTESQPPEGYHAAGFTWTESTDAIIQVWQYEAAEPEPESLETQVTELRATVQMLTDCILEMSEVVYE